MLELDPLSYLKEEYPPDRFRRLGIPEYALPKTHSSLPEKPYFQDKRALLREWVYNAFLFRYGREPPLKGSVTLFTWVIPGGFGDLTTQQEVASILQDGFPQLDLHLITLLEEGVEKYPSSSHPNQTIIRFKGKDRACIPPTLFKKTPLILQIPTYYPYWKKCREKLSPYTETVSVGEYGFIDSEEFNPQTGNLCMGLHSLEKGVLLPEMPQEKKGAESYFAYLYSERGFAIYLHALLQREQREKRDIVVTASPPAPLLLALKNQSWKGYGLKEILLYDDAHSSTIFISSEGTKKMVIHAKPFLSKETIQKEYARKKNFVGCRGDRSFSEALSGGAFFFYEGPNHSLPFLKDLYDVSYHYLFAFPTLHSYLQLLSDRKTDPKTLGHRIADLLEYPATWEGMKKLSLWIKENASFKETLKHLVQAKLHPEKEKHEALLSSFLDGEISLEKLLTPSIKGL